MNDHGESGLDADVIEPVGAQFPVSAKSLRYPFAVNDQGRNYLLRRVQELRVVVSEPAIAGVQHAG